MAKQRAFSPFTDGAEKSSSERQSAGPRATQPASEPCPWHMHTRCVCSAVTPALPHPAAWQVHGVGVMHRPFPDHVIPRGWAPSGFWSCHVCIHEVPGTFWAGSPGVRLRPRPPCPSQGSWCRGCTTCRPSSQLARLKGTRQHHTLAVFTPASLGTCRPWASGLK